MIDVDGVVSPVHGHTDWGDDVVAGHVFGPVLVSPGLCRRLDRLTARPAVEPVWLTDWDAEMRAAMDPFPGRTWQAIPRPWSDESGAAEALKDNKPWWKLKALLAWLDERPGIRTVVWADDHLARPRDLRLRADQVRYCATTRAQAVAQLLVERGIVAHLVAPDTEVGLTRADVRAMEHVVDQAG